MVTQPFAFTGTTGNDLVLFTEGSLNTLANTFKGGNPPPNIIAGQHWIDDTNDPTEWLLKLYDGVDHITVASVDPTGNTVTPFSAGSKLGTVANKNSGTANGEVPVLGVNGLPAIGGGDLTGTSLKSLAEAIKTADYTVVAADAGKVVVANLATAITFNLTAAATLGAGFACFVKNIGVGDLTIDPASAETVDGAATKVLQQNESTFLWTDGSNWRTLGTILQDAPAPAVPGLEFVSASSASASSSIDFTGLDLSGVDKWVIHFSGVQHSVNASRLYGLYGNGVYETTNYHWTWGTSQHWSTFANVDSTDTTKASIELINSISNTLANAYHGQVELSGFGDANKIAMVSWRIVGRASSSSRVQQSWGAGARTTADTYDRFQLKPDSGNFTVGEFVLFKVRAS